MTVYIKTGSKINVERDQDVSVFHALEPKTYAVQVSPFDELYLKEIDNMVIDSKIYGDTHTRADRVINTFLMRNTSTGVLLHGAKGSGKTLLAKMMSQKLREQGIATIIVNQELAGDKFNNFIQSISEPALILFDEFEKVYDRKSQERLLTLFDGTVGGKKLFVVTSNDEYAISDFFNNRPGRFYYSFSYAGIDDSFIRDYCEDVLENKSHIKALENLAASFDVFSFDILKAIVEEMNRYDETPAQVLEYINASPTNSRASYEVVDSELPADLVGYEVEKEINYGDWFNPFTSRSITFKLYRNGISKSGKESCEKVRAVGESDTTTDDEIYIYMTCDDIEKIDNGVITFSDDEYSFKIRKVKQKGFKFTDFMNA